jgi:hypothetical protein
MCKNRGVLIVKNSEKQPVVDYETEEEQFYVMERLVFDRLIFL